MAPVSVRSSRLLFGSISLLVFLIVWQVSDRLVKPIYFSTPTSVFAAFASMVRTRAFYTALGQTLVVVAFGLGLALVVGITIGFAMGRSVHTRRTLSPLISMAVASPFVALLPLMEIWFGLGTTSRVAFTFLLCIWMIIINTYSGVASLSEAHNELAASMGLSRLATLRHVVLPGASPFILAGIRIASAQAIVGAVLAGQEVGQNGLGGLANSYGSFFQTPQLIATIITSTLLAFLLFGSIHLYQRLRSPWIRAIGQG